MTTPNTPKSNPSTTPRPMECPQEPPQPQQNDPRANPTGDKSRAPGSDETRGADRTTTKPDTGSTGALGSRPGEDD